MDKFWDILLIIVLIVLVFVFAAFYMDGVNSYCRTAADAKGYENNDVRAILNVCEVHLGTVGDTEIWEPLENLPSLK